jgi:MYXO-CTERM domain-containing protein
MPLACNDGDPCTTDSCDAATGCMSSMSAAGTSCADADLCNGDETCNAAGSCVGGTMLDCDDGNPCTGDSCDADSGCENSDLAAGTSCSDGDPCNGDETCDGMGVCEPGTPIGCDGGVPEDGGTDGGVPEDGGADAGGGSDSGGSDGGRTDAGRDAGVPPPPAGDGCGCRIGDRPTGAALPLIAALFLLARRRRRPQG